MGHYQQIDHTADIALHVTGNDLEDLFITASQGWRHLITGASEVDPKERKGMNLNAASLEELLVECLSELNYLFVVKHWLFNHYYEFQIDSDDSSYSLLAKFDGEQFTEERHRIENEIKAVTFHQLQIRKDHHGYDTTIIFDI
jgi:SHS2 domain-containing protein